MCGINFILDKKGTLGDLPITQMSRALHGASSPAQFLTIRQSGRNYFFSDDRPRINASPALHNQDYILLFNGELYNHHDLKNSLIRLGYQFQSSSDAETLFYSLIEFGEKTIEKLDGKFVFIFYDRKDDILLAVRDRYGIKPVYYFENDRYLVISSEIKRLLASDLVPKQLNESQIPYFLRFRFAEKPYTFYKNIFEIPEACIAIRSGDGNLQIKTYHTPPGYADSITEEKQLVEKVEQALYESFLARTADGSATGLFLSGGVDSTLLLALAKDEGLSIPTFSVVSGKSAGSFKTDDNYYSRLAVKKFGSSVSHHEVTVDLSILEETDAMIRSLDQPVGDSGALLTWHLSAYAGAKLRNILTGAGADELFAGYNRHRAFYHYLTHYPLTRKIAPLAKTFSGMIPSGFNHPFRKTFRLVKKFLNDLDIDPYQTFLNFSSLAFPSPAPVRSGRAFNLAKLFSEALIRDRSYYLVSDVLAISNRTSVSHGVEMRMPYLDHQLTDLVNKTDPLLLINRGQKWILKDMLTRRGGREFSGRPKEGFGAPFGYWLKAPQLRYLQNEYAAGQEIIHKFIDPGLALKMYRDHIRGKIDYSSELFAYLVLTRWLKHEFSQ